MVGLLQNRLGRWGIGLGAAVMAVGGLSATAYAQRNPVYDAARQQGLVGEKMDGYLGFVGSPSAELRAVVEDINIKRKAVYADKARANNATVEEYALTAGCLAIARTQPGEKYQAPDGGWRTRTAEAPVRDSRCP
jgi:uncharacterized protein YdbL (DUF1318 family)